MRYCRLRGCVCGHGLARHQWNSRSSGGGAAEMKAVYRPGYQLGAAAATLLLERIWGLIGPAVSFALPRELKCRASSGPLPKRLLDQEAKGVRRPGALCLRLCLREVTAAWRGRKSKSIWQHGAEVLLSCGRHCETSQLSGQFQARRLAILICARTAKSRTLRRTVTAVKSSPNSTLAITRWWSNTPDLRRLPLNTSSQMFFFSPHRSSDPPVYLGI
jgi:hypothetical protein